MHQYFSHIQKQYTVDNAYDKYCLVLFLHLKTTVVIVQEYFLERANVTWPIMAVIVFYGHGFFWDATALLLFGAIIWVIAANQVSQSG